MRRLTIGMICQELADFLDVEAGAPETSQDSYWYARGAIEFAQHLKAALNAPSLDYQAQP